MSTKVHYSASRFTPEQRREIALKYAGLPWGQKGPFAQRLGISGDTLRSWVAACADGDLDNGLIPRKTGKMTTDDVAEITRLKKLLDDQHVQHAEALAQQEQKHAELVAAYEAKLADKDAEIIKLDKAADALGKAITVLHDLGGARGEAGNN